MAASGHPTSAIAPIELFWPTAGSRRRQSGNCAACACATKGDHRGETLAALCRHGWRLRSTSGSVVAPVHASDDASDLGPQDVVVLAMKGPSLGSALALHTPLLHESTVILTALNGVPWVVFR